MVVYIVVAIIVSFAFGILPLTGKIDRFIVGYYSTASEEERKHINIKRLRLLKAVNYWALSAIIFIFSRFPIHEKTGINILIIMGMILAMAIVSGILQIKWCKKKAED